MNERTNGLTNGVMREGRKEGNLERKEGWTRAAGKKHPFFPASGRHGDRQVDEMSG